VINKKSCLNRSDIEIIKDCLSQIDGSYYNTRGKKPRVVLEIVIEGNRKVIDIA